MAQRRYAAMQKILRSSQEAIRQHGFRKDAIYASHQHMAQSQLDAYFPTSEQATQQLLKTFDRMGLEQAATADHTLPELILAGKLLHSEPYRDHLVEAIALLTASGSLLRILPSPAPSLARAWSIVDEASYLALPTVDEQDWYASRIRLTNAFVLAELHMLSPDYSGNVHDSLRLFRKLAKKNIIIPSNAPDLGAWTMWGTRGWLGIFRSLGL